MNAKGDPSLTNEDRILWGKVARSVKPLPGKVVDATVQEDDDFSRLLADEAKPPRPSADAPTVAHPARQPGPGQHGIDRPTRQKLAKGRLPIEGKVDLHGLTQNEAHSLLLSFLHRAHADGRRHVLVVTGKGSSLGSEGALKRAVPAWFATPAFRGIVSGHETAARGHGGSGAIYVRLRKGPRG
jgi:DNA-nicking Smr family endonuclease